MKLLCIIKWALSIHSFDSSFFVIKDYNLSTISFSQDLLQALSFFCSDLLFFMEREFLLSLFVRREGFSHLVYFWYLWLLLLRLLSTIFVRPSNSLYGQDLLGNSLHIIYNNYFCILLAFASLVHLKSEGCYLNTWFA